MKPSTLNLNLDKVEAESTSMFSKVPDGDYVVTVAHAQFKEGKKSGAAGLQVGFMIEEGPQKGKMVQDYINIANENEQAVEIGHRRLKLIMVCQNRKTFGLKTDMDLISRAKFMISTALETDKFFDKQGMEKEIEKSVVKKIFAMENAPAQTESAASKTTGVTKTTAKPVVETKVAPVAEDDVAEEGNDDVPPWMR